MTYNACGTIKWNNGVSFPIQSGHGCLGCSEENFWDNGPFYERMTKFPGFGIESNADKIGITAAGMVGAGLLAHGIIASASKRAEVLSRIKRGKTNVEEIKNE